MVQNVVLGRYCTFLVFIVSYVLSYFSLCSATAGEDYESVNMTLTFTEATTSFAVVLEVLGDSVVEGDEVLVARIVVPEGENGVSLKSSRAEITIIDDDSMCV